MRGFPGLVSGPGVGTGSACVQATKRRKGNSHRPRETVPDLLECSVVTACSGSLHPDDSPLARKVLFAGVKAPPTRKGFLVFAPQATEGVKPPPPPLQPSLRVALSHVFDTQLLLTLSFWGGQLYCRMRGQLMWLPHPPTPPVAMVTACPPVPAEYCFLVTFLPPSLSSSFFSHKKKAQVFYIHFAKCCVVHTNWCGFLLL